MYHSKLFPIKKFKERLSVTTIILKYQPIWDFKVLNLSKNDLSNTFK